MPVDRLSFRDRNKRPSTTFGVGFQAALHSFAAEFINSEAVKHAQTKGESREVPVRKFFQGHLPMAFDVRKGEATDVDDNHGPSIDLMIFDRHRNFPLFEAEDGMVLPAEALLASIEVKSSLTSAETEKIFEAAQRLHQLRPFKKSVTGRRSGGARAEGEPRFFHCVFAYDSDLSKDKWLEREHDRLAKIAREKGVDTEIVQRIYVLNRGLINFSAGTGCTEAAGEGTSFMQFYMHILNFLSRENIRRDPVPYIEYAGKMGGGWRSLRRPASVRT